MRIDKTHVSEDGYYTANFERIKLADGGETSAWVVRTNTGLVADVAMFSIDLSDYKLIERDN